MIYEWIRNHKKLAALIGAGVVLLLGIVIAVIVNLIQNPNPHEEEEKPVGVSVSNLTILYDHFSDYDIGYVFNALNKALLLDQSMKNGSPASENSTPAINATDDQLYPSANEGNYTLTVKDGVVKEFEDTWGTWKTFTVTAADNRSFKVDVAIGAHNREKDVNYTPITITKL